MHVLMPEVASPMAAEAADALTAAGHAVHTCHDPGHQGFACVALRDGDCPLEASPIDVVLGVRRSADPQPRRSEDALLCGARHRIPLVVAGATEPNPFERWTSATSTVADVVAAVEAAAIAPLPVQTAAAAEELEQALRLAGTDPAGASVVVFRRMAGLRVELTLPAGVPPRVAHAAAVRVDQAVRGVDPWAVAVDVVVVPS
ncbi:MAG TPA: hypothetical protein VHN98_12800 [Acidimicrobiales bacterium]|nr:hypothetical protein [Acidimicrobiales bacterium]